MGGESEEGCELDRCGLGGCTPKHRTQVGEKTKLRYLAGRENFPEKSLGSFPGGLAGSPILQNQPIRLDPGGGISCVSPTLFFFCLEEGFCTAGKALVLGGDLLPF